MQIKLRFFILLAAGAILPAASSPAASDGRIATVTVSRAAETAWEELRSADAKIGRVLAAGQFAEVPAQAEIIISAVRTIGRGAHTTDDAILKRFNSVTREVLALADRLIKVAATGDRACTRIVHANLHRYVVFAETHLPRNPGGNSKPDQP